MQPTPSNFPLHRGIYHWSEKTALADVYIGTKAPIKDKKLKVKYEVAIMMVMVSNNIIQRYRSN